MSLSFISNGMSVVNWTVRRAIKKLCNSVQYDASFFNTVSLHINTYCELRRQKCPSFQSDWIAHACCRDTTPLLTWTHHHRKTAFHEDDSSGVETGRNRWVPSLVSKVDETAVQLRCPWLWLVQLETCAGAYCYAAALDIGSACTLSFSLNAWLSSFSSSL